ncbi:MAG TPA: GTP-binding protein [Gemmatimonadales bacterium]|jgi:bifunctional enzyme CysN/CysC|nr:GTP-binding protein [Gemmatimonadales bacterium]
MGQTGVAPAAVPAEQGSGAAGQRMNIVIGGHVDHGKSTIVGRLLADTGSLPEGKLEQVKELCARTARPFEYAFLLDALKDEQAQGITIDAARVFFKTARRHYIIIDAPGHIEFLKNMITGASRAEAALLVIDAREGVQENSRRHGYMMSMLGVRQIAVLVNKMDLVGYDRGHFEGVVREYRAFLDRIGVHPACFIPVAGREGDNIAQRSARMPWYHGDTVLEALDRFVTEPPPLDKPFRMPVQDVYKFTAQGDDRRIVAGTIETGTLRVGDEVVFYPSGKRSRVKTIEAFNRPPQTEARAGMATGFTLTEQIYVSRGEIAALAGQPKPEVTTRLRVSLFWLGKQPLVTKRDYLLKLGTARVPCRLEAVHRVVDASSLSASESKDRIERHDVAECTLKLGRAVAFDLADRIAATSRFVIVDEYEIRGGGIVREALPDNQSWVREKVMLRNFKWEPSIIPAERRAERYSQKAALLLITGARDTDRKSLGKDLEARLFAEGRVVYFLGMANVLYGVDADIDRGQEHRAEHLRRLGEIANIMLDSGAILIVTAAELTQEDLEVIKTAVSPDRIEVVWVGDQVTTDVSYDLILGDHEAGGDGVDRIKLLLQDKGILFRPW